MKDYCEKVTSPTMRTRTFFFIFCIAGILLLAFTFILEQTLMPSSPSLPRQHARDKIKRLDLDSIEASRINNAASHKNPSGSIIKWPQTERLNSATVSTTSSTKDRKCPDILAGMSKGRWVTRPLTDFEQMSIDAYLQAERSAFRIPPTFQRRDGRCGNNITYEETPQYNHMWFKSICNPKGSTPCCKDGRCINLPVEECRCPDCFDERQVIYPEYSTWRPEDERCTQTAFTTEEACRLLEGSTIHVAGDSFVREMYIALAILLSGDNVGGALRKDLATYERNQCLGLFQVTGASCRHSIFEYGTLCNDTVTIQYTELWNAKNVNLLTGILQELQGKPKSFLVLGIGIHDNFNSTLMEQDFFNPLVQTYRNIQQTIRTSLDQSDTKIDPPELPIGQDIMAANLEPAQISDSLSDDTNRKIQAVLENPDFKSLQTRFLLSNTGKQRVEHEENIQLKQASFQAENENQAVTLSSNERLEIFSKLNRSEVESEHNGKLTSHIDNVNNENPNRVNQAKTEADPISNYDSASGQDSENSNYKRSHKPEVSLGNTSPQVNNATLDKKPSYYTEAENTERSQRDKGYFRNSNDIIRNVPNQKSSNLNRTFGEAKPDKKLLYSNHSEYAGVSGEKLSRRNFHEERSPSQDIKVHEDAKGDGHNNKTSYQRKIHSKSSTTHVDNEVQTALQNKVTQYKKLQAGEIDSPLEKKSLGLLDIKSTITNRSNTDIGSNGVRNRANTDIGSNVVRNRANTDLKISNSDTDRSKTGADRSKTDIDRSKTDMGRSNTDTDRSKSDMGRSNTDTDRSNTDTDRSNTDTDRSKTDMGRSNTDTDRSETDINRSKSDMGRSNTDTDRSNTDTDRSNTDTDRSNTDTDRSKTDMGRSNTDTDRSETDINRSKSDMGRSNTDTDRSNTDTDRSKTDTDRSKTDIVRSKTDIDRSNTVMDRSNTDTDRPKTDLHLPHTDTDRSKTDIDRSNTDTDRSNTDTDRSKTDTDRSKTDTDRSKTDIDRSNTVMDRSNTDTDRPKTDLHLPHTDTDRSKTDIDRSNTDTDRSKTDMTDPNTDKNDSETMTRSNSPHLFWMGIHAPGLLKSPHFEAQSADGVRRFNKAIEAILERKGIPYLNTFGFTDGVLSFDGTHYGFAVNMLKTNMFLTYIRETFTEDGAWR